MNQLNYSGIPQDVHVSKFIGGAEFPPADTSQEGQILNAR